LFHFTLHLTHRRSKLIVPKVGRFSTLLSLDRPPPSVGADGPEDFYGNGEASEHTEAANGGVLQIICSAAARTLKLDMMPES